MDGWKIIFLWGWPIFRGHVSFRECVECHQLVTDCWSWSWSLGNQPLGWQPMTVIGPKIAASGVVFVGLVLGLQVVVSAIMCNQFFLFVFADLMIFILIAIFSI